MQSTNTWSAQRIFLWMASIFGLLFLVITPPFQTPDEVNHFYKAYQISEGQFVSTIQNDRVGGYLPQDVAHVAESFFPLAGRMHAKTSAEHILSKFKGGSKEREFVDFANTAVYAPISYAPQAFGMFIGNRFGASPLVLMYVGRLCSLIFWIVCVFFAIRLAPSFKWLLTLIALLPMSISVNSAISADVMSNALAFLVIAHVLMLAQTDAAWTRRHWFYALGLGVLLASAKLVYVPIFLLYLLVPIRKFSSKRSFFVQLGTLAGVTLLTVFVWSQLMAGTHLTYAEYNQTYRDLSNLSVCADIGAQSAYIAGNWSFLMESFSTAFVVPFDMYARGYIGTFGWIDTFLPTWTIVIAYCMILFVAIADFSGKLRLKAAHRFVLLCAALLMFLLVVLSQLLIWTCVGDPVVTNLQGRYFIPVFPLVFMAFGGLIKRKVAWLPAMIVLGCSVFLSFSLFVIYSRFYVPSVFTDVGWKMSASEIAKDGAFMTDYPNTFSAPADFSSALKDSQGGVHFMVSKESPFGAPINVHDCQLGDWITFKADRLGTGGGIVVTRSDGSLYRFEQGKTHSSDSTWEHLETSLLISQPKYAGEYSVYLYQPEGDSSVFDNLEVIHRQFRR